MNQTAHHTLVMEHPDEAAALLDEQDAEIKWLRAQLTETGKWRDYYRAKYLGPMAVPQLEPPDSSEPEP